MKYLIVGAASDPEQFNELPNNIDFEDVTVFTFENGSFIQVTVDEDGEIEFEEEVNCITKESDPQYWKDEVEE